MSRYRCYACPAKRPGQWHEFEADAPACPKCGAGEPAVLELADVHFLAPDPKGPFTGCVDGIRRKIGCEPSRDVLAMHQHDMFHATEDPRAVTCRRCRGLEAWRQAASAFREMRAVLLSGEPGCCG